MQALFMLLIGCRPAGRFIEQHDVYFGIGEEVKDLLPGIIDFWPEAKGKMHIDAWRKVTNVDGFTISVIPKQLKETTEPSLFFINLGGYKQNEFEEFHYKMLSVANNKNEAIKQSKQTAFFKHTGFKGAVAHIDDKYGVDVDDIFDIKNILPPLVSNQYSLKIEKNNIGTLEDELHLGYFKLADFK